MADGAGFATVYPQPRHRRLECPPRRRHGRARFITARWIWMPPTRGWSRNTTSYARNSTTRSRIGWRSWKAIATWCCSATIARWRSRHCYNLTGNPERRWKSLTSRRFHPWEGGEGSVLRQFTTAHLLLGRQALEAGDAGVGAPPFHRSDGHPGKPGRGLSSAAGQGGCELLDRPRAESPRPQRTRRKSISCMSAVEAGDFSDMAVTAHSPLSYFRGLSLRELGREDEAAGIVPRPQGICGDANSWKPRRSTISPPRCRICWCSTRTCRPAAMPRTTSCWPWPATGSAIRPPPDPRWRRRIAFTHADQRAAELAPGVGHDMSKPQTAASHSSCISVTEHLRNHVYLKILSAALSRLSALRRRRVRRSLRRVALRPRPAGPRISRPSPTTGNFRIRSDLPGMSPRRGSAKPVDQDRLDRRRLALSRAVQGMAGG